MGSGWARRGTVRVMVTVMVWLAVSEAPTTNHNDVCFSTFSSVDSTKAWKGESAKDRDGAGGPPWQFT